MGILLPGDRRRIKRAEETVKVLKAAGLTPVSNDNFRTYDFIDKAGRVVPPSEISELVDDKSPLYGGLRSSNADRAVKDRRQKRFISSAVIGWGLSAQPPVILDKTNTGVNGKGTTTQGDAASSAELATLQKRLELAENRVKQLSEQNSTLAETVGKYGDVETKLQAYKDLVKKEEEDYAKALEELQKSNAALAEKYDKLYKGNDPYADWSTEQRAIRGILTGTKINRNMVITPSPEEGVYQELPGTEIDDPSWYTIDKIPQISVQKLIETKGRGRNAYYDDSGLLYGFSDIDALVPSVQGPTTRAYFEQKYGSPYDPDWTATEYYDPNMANYVDAEIPYTSSTIEDYINWKKSGANFVKFEGGDVIDLRGIQLKYLERLQKNLQKQGLQ